MFKTLYKVFPRQKTEHLAKTLCHCQSSDKSILMKYKDLQIKAKGYKRSIIRERVQERLIKKDYQACNTEGNPLKEQYRSDQSLKQGCPRRSQITTPGVESPRPRPIESGKNWTDRRKDAQVYLNKNNSIPLRIAASPTSVTPPNLIRARKMPNFAKIHQNLIQKQKTPQHTADKFDPITNQNDLKLTKGIHIFRSIEPYLFPVVPKNLDSFLLYLLLNSLLLTISTPMTRIFRGRWMGYADEADSPGIDRAFGLHAFFGLLWVLSCYLQMGPIRNMSVWLHQRFGYLAITAFVCHMLASFNTLIFDEAQHQPLAKVMLGNVVLVSSTYMVLAIKAVKNKDIRGHTDYAVRSFLYSIEGAGTIRTVASIQGLLSPVLPQILIGPAECQNIHLGQATQCIGEYATRLLLTRLLTLYYIGHYTRMKGAANYAKVIILELCVALVCTLAFCSVMAFKAVITFQGCNHLSRL